MKKNDYLSVSAEGFHRISYNEWGKSSLKPPVFCVHGFLRNNHDFDALSYFLSQNKRHVYCPDLAGRGDSDWFKNPSHYTFEQYIVDMTTLIAKSTAKSVDWIGTSLGGLIGMMMAAMPNTPIARLVLNDIGPQVPLAALKNMANYVNVNPSFFNKEEAVLYYKTLYKDFGNLSESEWLTFTEHSIKERPSGLLVPKCDPAILHNKTHVQFFWELLHHPHKALEGIFYDVDLWSVWQKVTCPVLIIHGRHSEFLLPKHIMNMQKTHPFTEVIEIEDAGHAPALLRAEEHEKIAAWLEKTSA